MWKSLGQDDAIKMFSVANSENRLAHSYLFFGPDRVGKRTTMTWWMCHSPNPVHVFAVCCSRTGRPFVVREEFVGHDEPTRSAHSNRDPGIRGGGIAYRVCTSGLHCQTVRYINKSHEIDPTQVENGQ